MPLKPIFRVRRCILIILLVFIFLCRYSQSISEWYVQTVYPSLTGFLSALSSFTCYSLEEFVVVFFLILLIAYPIIARRKADKTPKRRIITTEIELIAWIYVWFYLGWGINYFRSSFFTRTDTTPVEYADTIFRQFLLNYTDSLNSYYLPETEFGLVPFEEEIKALYDQRATAYGLCRPRSYQHPKKVLFNALYSGVGVLGYMGPFFAESQLNSDLLPLQRPYTYAHELSHLLGVSSEAEANFWAYYICTHTTQREIRYSGYFGLLPYVILNAGNLLDKETYAAWLATIRPEIIDQLKDIRVYWKARYSPFIGSIQNKLYDWFLKNNRIGSGRKNYAEVINMVIAWHIGKEMLD